MSNKEWSTRFFFSSKFKVYRVRISSAENLALALASLTTKTWPHWRAKPLDKFDSVPPSKRRHLGVPSDKLSILCCAQAQKHFQKTLDNTPKNCVLFFCKSVGSWETQSNKRQSISMTGSALTNNCFLLPLTNVLGATVDVCVVIRSDGEGTSALPKVPPDLMWTICQTCCDSKAVRPGQGSTLSSLRQPRSLWQGEEGSRQHNFHVYQWCTWPTFTTCFSS